MRFAILALPCLLFATVVASTYTNEHPLPTTREGKKVASLSSRVKPTVSNYLAKHGPTNSHLKVGDLSAGDRIDFRHLQGSTPLSTYYEIRWKAIYPLGCEPAKASTIDLECYDSDIAIVDVDDGDCNQLTDSAIRCERISNNPSNASGVLATCTGIRTEYHGMLIRMPEMKTPTCNSVEAFSHSIFVRRQCRTEASKYNTELFPSFVCRGDLRNSVECIDFVLPYCDFVNGFCVHADVDGVLVIATNPETERCLYDAAEEGLTYDGPTLDEQLDPLAQAVSDGVGGNTLNATYRVYFEYRKSDDATNCEIPLEDVYLGCANGQLPSLFNFSSAACGPVTLASGQRFLRCMGTERTSGRADVLCQGSSDSEVQLHAFQRATALPACQVPGQARALIWMAELCGGETVPGGIETIGCISGQASFQEQQGLWLCAASCELGGSCTGLPANLASKRANSCVVGESEDTSGCRGLFGQPFLFSPFCWIIFLVENVLGLFGLS